MPPCPSRPTTRKRPKCSGSEAGVARATLESLAENFSDGVVAHLFWIALGGLMGGALYKALKEIRKLIKREGDMAAV